METITIDYAIRKSPRARHVWLRFDREGRLCVVVPRRFDVSRVPAIVESHAGWIERTRRKVEARRRRVLAEPVPALPRTITLPVAGRELQVEYRATPSARMILREHGNTLVMSGPVDESVRCRDAIVRWLRRQAHEYLSAVTTEIASTNGFEPGKVVIRSQRTRWASCSRKRTLSLNLRLLFLEPELARHVVLHELCHTKHMDHSRKFWSCVAKHDPDWREHRRRLRSAWNDMPRWLEAESVGPVK